MSGILAQGSAFFAKMGKNLGCKVSIPTKGRKTAHTLRTPTPPYSRDDLKKAMTVWIKENGIKSALSFGAYDKILLSQAVRGIGLCQNSAFLKILLEVSPCAKILHSDMKWAVQEVSHTFDTLVPAGRPLERWASEVAERVFTLLNHLRRVVHSAVRMRQACRGLDNQNVMILKELQGKMHIDSEASSCSGPILDSKTEVSISPDDSISQVLVRCPPVSKISKKKDDKTAKSSKSDPRGHALPGGQRLFLVLAKNQSYIQVRECNGTGKKLVVACSQTQSTEHQQLMSMILTYLLEQGTCDKTLAMKLRAHLMA